MVDVASSFRHAPVVEKHCAAVCRSSRERASHRLLPERSFVKRVLLVRRVAQRQKQAADEWMGRPGARFAQLLASFVLALSARACSTVFEALRHVLRIVIPTAALERFLERRTERRLRQLAWPSAACSGVRGLVSRTVSAQ